MIITGMSGAGKSRAIEVFEDMDYNCVDNMPPSLITKFVEICCGPGAHFNRLCIVVDCRIGELFESLSGELKALKAMGFQYRVLFLEASDEVLKRRYKETRHRHPLEKLAGGDISKAITMERQMLRQARSEADVVVDTSLSSAKTLKELIAKKFSTTNHNMSVTVMSFGFKYGPQNDADLLLDVRCLPNPYYIEELRPLTGLDAEIYDYVFQWDESKEMFSKLADLITFSLPLYGNEGRSNLTIAFGCTGGQHRSVSFARRMGELIEKMGYNVSVIHRDIEK
ncbi:MAG: RNase adapter RapZ [Clostridia bacterium]|nr:RNase adapter RapZ [Clostridia bacterium]